MKTLGGILNHRTVQDECGVSSGGDEGEAGWDGMQSIPRTHVHCLVTFLVYVIAGSYEVE